MAYIDNKFSTFPEKIDQFQEVYDLTPSQVESAQRLTKLKLQPSLTNAEQEEVLIITSQLRDVMITPDTFNKFSSSLYSTQKFFRDNVQGFLEGKQLIWDSYIQSFKHVGVWQNGKSYKFQNLVSTTNGDLYICLKDHASTTNNAPALNSTLWRKIGAKGDKGDPGLSGIYKGAWSSATTYALGDAVTFEDTGINGGLIYISKSTNVNKKPSTNAVDWLLYTQVITGTIAPIGAAKGTHFRKVVSR